ncbi:hypothetical protein HK104_000763, partial [Borealophlyctis nickersoniae]
MPDMTEIRMAAHVERCLSGQNDVSAGAGSGSDAEGRNGQGTVRAGIKGKTVAGKRKMSGPKNAGGAGGILHWTVRFGVTA